MQTVDLGLPRPQYVSVPEGFIVALACQEYRQLVDAGEPGEPAVAFAYETLRAGTKSKGLRYVATRPKDERLTRFSNELENAGLFVEHDQRSLGEAVATAIAGVQTQEGKARSSVPMAISLSLLQNMRGLVGTRNPPDTAKILETFFAMGSHDGGPVLRAGQYWARATQHRRSIDPLVSFIDDAARESLLEDVVVREVAPLPAGRDLAAFRNTPFAWFYRTWVKLCSEEWVEALPARVWVDWASAVLRLAFGMGYLWEVAWYEQVSRAVLTSTPMDGASLGRQIGALVPWRDSMAAVSVRDIAAATRWRVMRSQEVRVKITDWTSDNRDPSANVAEQLGAMAADKELVRMLGDAGSGGGSSNVNLWEAINYTLRTRAGTGESTDHYGLWRKQGPRYSVPDPGVEWMAAIASLSCPGPGTSTNVGQLMADLRDLGLRPELGDLLARLERAGVARGSADADQAVEIRSAF